MTYITYIILIQKFILQLWHHAGYGMNAYLMAPVCYEIAPCIYGSTRR